jgi:hypothetical protein
VRSIFNQNQQFRLENNENLHFPAAALNSLLSYELGWKKTASRLGARLYCTQQNEVMASSQKRG